MKAKNRKYLGITVITWLVLLIVWQLVTALKITPEILLPSPEKVITTFINLSKYGYNGIPLWYHFMITMLRLLSAVGLAIITAIPLGLLSGRIKIVYAIFDSIIQFIRPIPPLAYYTLLILWVGIGETSKVVLLYLAAFAPIYLACISGVRKVNVDYIKSARSLGASSTQVFFHIIFPSALPDIFTGIRTSVGMAYTTVVAAEMVAATYGIGWMIVNASKYLKSDVMFVGIFILGITGVILDQLLKLIERKIVFWSGKS
ncbi:ABC transporter permease [Companilactobacillus allii]|uniref:Taurine ABC transporter permease n=1 Tax=Companilactobacillus allii TaxID=1847728 RepID=A0A1P8Q306_9LACO|nr:ABC transporter permease [Companilactobacillus allii]APX72206.1 taurine ABC transporter permease [Companilactobacillus allii]USQ69301.1 ABC transporter permease [Companilactobacillus allii]